MKSYSYCLLALAVIGAALAAPLKVDHVLATVPLKQSPTDASKFIAIIPSNSTYVVIKFDKPILAEIEKTSHFLAEFEEVKITDGESSIVKLKFKGLLQKPVVVNVKDKKSGDEAKVMIKKEGGGDGEAEGSGDKKETL